VVTDRRGVAAPAADKTWAEAWSPRGSHKDMAGKPGGAGAMDAAASPTESWAVWRADDADVAPGEVSSGRRDADYPEKSGCHHSDRENC
jgi:hypothetical protein